MKTVYYAFFEEYGEIDAFFNEKMKLITFWYGNDASYRPEYMDSLFKHCGVAMKSLPRSKRKAAVAELRKAAPDAFYDEGESE